MAAEFSAELVFLIALVLLPLIPAIVLFKALPSKGQISDIRVRLSPPDYVVNADGSGGTFMFDVPVLSRRGRSQFPRLYVDLPGYETLSVSLAADDQDGDGSDVTVRRNDEPREIHLGKITLRSLSLVDTPYDAAKAQIGNAEQRFGSGQ